MLEQFWQDLRDKMHVTIAHPELPDALRAIAANAVQSIWQAANEAAAGELDAAQRARAALQGELEAERQAHAAAQTRKEEGRRQIEALPAY
ncbi:hypothetical protein [Cupriavidus basilensis]|uniref:hypothetical protein n=1 Tax=Cupriavidus basilensis TaxID=68895 RepID=UPI0039F6B7EC